MIVVAISFRLGMRTLDALVDRAPSEIEQRIIVAAEGVPGVVNCHRVRLRYSGPQLFVDLHANVDGSQTLASAHSVTDAIENAIREVEPGADVTVHAEPA